MSSEQWVPVAEWEALYEVSDQGRVRSLDRIDALGRFKRGRDMRLVKHPGGYLGVSFCGNGLRNKRYFVHRLVATAFHGSPAEGLQVCHNNGDPSDNRATNLRWDTSSANLRDKALHGTNHNRNRTHCPRGHPLQEPNLTPGDLKKGFRSCRSCCSASWFFKRQPRPAPEIFDGVADAYALKFLGATWQGPRGD